MTTTTRKRVLALHGCVIVYDIFLYNTDSSAPDFRRTQSSSIKEWVCFRSDYRKANETGKRQVHFVKNAETSTSVSNSSATPTESPSLTNLLSFCRCSPHLASWRAWRTFGRACGITGEPRNGNARLVDRKWGTYQSHWALRVFVVHQEYFEEPEVWCSFDCIFFWEIRGLILST